MAYREAAAEEEDFVPRGPGRSSMKGRSGVGASRRRSGSPSQGLPRSTCTTTLSWTFESRPTTMESKSPRSTAPCQTLAPSSIVTSPTSTALGATWIIVSLEVHEDVLHVRVEEDRVDSLFQAQAGLLPPEEGRLRERDGILVD